MNHPLNVNLTNLRNPRNGKQQVTVRKFLTAGVFYQVGADQHEKLVRWGFMQYGWRCRTSGYVLEHTLLRNKSGPSVMLSGTKMVNHVRGFLSWTTRFDDGNEGADWQRWYKKKTGREESVIKGSSTDNCHIELWWNIWYQKYEWFYIIEFVYLEIHLLLDIDNPIHLACLWDSYAPLIQFDGDDLVSSFNEKKMYVILCILTHK